jgi:hypothetical protein
MNGSQYLMDRTLCLNKSRDRWQENSANAMLRDVPSPPRVISNRYVQSALMHVHNFMQAVLGIVLGLSDTSIPQMSFLCVTIPTFKL